MGDGFSVAACKDKSNELISLATERCKIDGRSMSLPTSTVNSADPVLCELSETLCLQGSSW
jgi:hypothetical protein